MFGNQMKIVNRKISELIPAEYNPRKITEKEIKDIEASFNSLGTLEPAVINMHSTRLNQIISGHQRIKVYKLMGNSTYPCYEVKFTLDKEKEANIRMNKNTGSWDWDLLGSGFEKEDLEDWGFDSELDDIFGEDEDSGGLTDDDAIPPVPVEPITKLGDLYILGKHKLLCGDSTNIQHVERLMDGDKADLCLADPPYGIGYGGSMKLGQKKHGWTQHKGGWDEKRPDKKWFDISKSFSENQIVWGGNYFTDILPMKMGWLIWDKGQRDFTLADGEMAWTSFNNALRIKTVSRASALKDGKVHATQKSIEIMIWCFEYSKRHSKSNPNLILDLFGGSGSTLIACQKTDRKCRMMELDPIYCDVIIKRWEEYTGKKAELI